MKINKISQRNKQVAAKRGDEWKKKLVEGKYDAQKNPTILKGLRVSKGESQDKIAEAVGVSLTTYGAIERGLRAVKKHLAQYIAQYYGVDVKKVFKETEGKYFALKSK